MTDLMAKLEAAISETERIARATFLSDSDDGDWMVCTNDDGEVNGVLGRCVHIGMTEGNGDLDDPAQAEHIARNSPKRVLRRVVRDRKLLERHQPFEVWGGGGHIERWLIAVECSYCWNFDRNGDRDDYGAGREWPCGDVRDLAEDYEIKGGA